MLLWSTQLCSWAIKNVPLPFFLSKSTLFILFFSAVNFGAIGVFMAHEILHSLYDYGGYWLWCLHLLFQVPLVLPLRGSEILVLTSLYTYIIMVDELKENIIQSMLATRRNQWLMWGTQANARNSFTSRTFSPTVSPECCPACNRSALQRSIDCLVKQYESYSSNVNGTFTLLENTADTGGLAVAYQVLPFNYVCNLTVPLHDTQDCPAAPLSHIPLQFQMPRTAVPVEHEPSMSSVSKERGSSQSFARSLSLSI